MTLFRGLSAFPLTPTDEAGRIDAAALCALLQRLVEAGVDSVGLLGSTGIYAYLERPERRRAIEVAADHLGGRIPLMAGIGALRTGDAQALAGDAEAAGAQGLLLAPVSYLPLTDEEVFAHFTAVAGATGLPICIYNNPSTTHFTFSDALVARLAANPRIVAVKHPAPAPAEAPARLAALRHGLPENFAIGFSGDWHAADAILAGAAAWYSVLAGLLPRPALALMRAAQAGAEADVRRMNGALQPLWDLFRQHGSLRVIYAAANLLGLTGTQPPRPILPLGHAEREQIARALDGLHG